MSAAIIGGLFALICVAVTSRIKHHDDDIATARASRSKLDKIGAQVDLVIKSQAELWEAVDEVRADVSYLTGSLGVRLPGRR